jgi:hypothetical protein
MFSLSVKENIVREYLTKSGNIIKVFDTMRDKIRGGDDLKTSLRIEKTNWENFKYLHSCVELGEMPSKVVFYVIKKSIDWNVEAMIALQNRYE